MNISVYMNDCEKALTSECTLNDALVHWGYTGKFVVAINGEFVPRSCHKARLLSDGDRVDVLRPVSGG